MSKFRVQLQFWWPRDGVWRPDGQVLEVDEELSDKQISELMADINEAVENELFYNGYTATVVSKEEFDDDK